MTRPSCARGWQVEAARDDRLDAAALVSFKQHLGSCAICQSEQRGLDQLAVDLSRFHAQPDEVAVRRLRQGTLELANASMLRAEPRKRRVRKLSTLLVASGLAVAAAALFVLARPAPAPLIAAVQVEPEQNTQWRRKLEQNVEQVELTSGTLLFRVARKPSDPRLLVRVPDGEIEDLGTTFSVTVQGGKTREIVVREGRVMFHRRGAPALHLVQGSSWTAPVEAPPRVAPSPVLAPNVAQVVPAEPAMPKPKSVTPRGHAVGGDRATPKSEPKTVPAGNSEDAAYLQILALLREGRTDEARLSAFSYLRTFPSGFRKVEVERVAAMHDDGDASTVRKPD